MKSFKSYLKKHKNKKLKNLEINRTISEPGGSIAGALGGGLAMMGGSIGMGASMGQGGISEDKIYHNLKIKNKKS